MSNLITVGIPVFNAMPYLPESLESILRQSSLNFSVLVINDGSTDDSLAYLQSVKDPRVRVVSQTNHGLTATLNRMLAEVETPWLARFDADDVALPDRIAITADYIRRFPESGMFYSLAEYFPSSSVGRFRSTKGSPDQIRDLVRSGRLPAICHPTVTLNVKKTCSLGGYRFNLHVEDIDLWWRMALEHEIRMIPAATVGFRQNQQSVSSANLEKQALNTLYVQYLLLSRLHGRAPLPYEQAASALLTLLNRRRLTFKALLRASNMELGQGHTLRGAWKAGLAFLASPSDFWMRCLDEVVPTRVIGLGEPAAFFECNQNTLWPEALAARPAAMNQCADAAKGTSRIAAANSSSEPQTW